MDERVEMVTKHLQYLAEQANQSPSWGIDFVRVAHYLYAAGIRGRKGRAASCPVANYLNRETGLTVAVSGMRTAVYDSQNRCIGEIDNPSSVTRFVTAFDAHHFPLLEEIPLSDQWQPVI